MAQERIGGEILKGHVTTLVMSVLGETPRHGYDIMKILSERSRGVFELGQGTIYPLLYSLEEEGLIKSATAVVDGRTRRVYSLSASGRRSLARRRQTWQTFQTAINSVLEPARMGALSYARI